MIITSADQSTLEADITTADILQRIEVTPPYFALENLYHTADDEVCAAIRREQPMGLERGCMAAAEVGRHLAILGSCAAARKNPKSGRHYYLASSAHLRLVAHESLLLSPVSLLGRARARFVENRVAEAETRLIDQATGQDLYRLDVQYQVMSERLFERMFVDYADDSPAPEFNPYAIDSIPIGDEFMLDDLLSANIGPLDPTTCAGHFPRFPALPVAILTHILSRSAGTLLSNVVGGENVPYAVVDARVKSENLAFAADKLHLVIQHKGTENEGRDYVFRCRALAERAAQRPFGDMQVTLRPLLNGKNSLTH